MARYRIEVKVDDALRHVKSGQDLSGRGMKDAWIEDGALGWFVGLAAQGVIGMPTKGELRRAEPALDLSRYANAEGDRADAPGRVVRRERAPAARRKG